MSDESDSGSSGGGDLDAMRRSLESSWNAEAMGVVPSSPEKGAEAAATSIGNAMRDGLNLLMVDILLPSYDITQGSNYYDEIVVVEFCKALAKCMKDSNLVEQSAILLKNGKAVRDVTKILEVREGLKAEETQTKEDEVITDQSSAIDENDDDDDEDEYSDFDDMPTSIDVDSFRQQLMSTWEEEPSSSDDDNTEPSPPTEEPSTQSSPHPPAKTTFRIGSLFGDAHISKGPDMFDDVIEAVDEHAIQETDDAVLIVSAVSQDDMIAIRRIAAKWEDSSKKIILVNCRLNVMPLELMMAETVYSILPLIAKKTTSDDNVFASKKEQGGDGETPPPKIVVMRRYPLDWEVYVDVDGSGFELVDSMSARVVGTQRNPPMDWIAGCVKRHMQFKFGK